jgi:hypothetical protein
LTDLPIMPTHYADQGLAVVPVAIDFAGLPAVDRFYAEVGVRNLGKYVDDTRARAHPSSAFSAYPA